MKKIIKLKFGDKVYEGVDHSYHISIVERLTPTMAILSNSARVYNQQVNKLGLDGFIQVGDQWTIYCIVTDEILEKKRAKEEDRKVKRWFDDYNFSLADKKMIYEKFKELGKIEP